METSTQAITPTLRAFSPLSHERGLELLDIVSLGMGEAWPQFLRIFSADFPSTFLSSFPLGSLDDTPETFYRLGRHIPITLLPEIEAVLSHLLQAFQR